MNRNQSIDIGKQLIRAFVDINKELTDVLYGDQGISPPEKVHHARILIKRIKAYANLMRQLNPEYPYTTLMEVYNPVFKQLGEQRDRYVQSRILDPGLDSYLGMSSGVAQTFRDMHTMLRMSRLHQNLDLSLTSFSFFKIFIQYAGQLFDKIESLINKSFDKLRLLHQVRIAVKEIKYNLHLIDRYVFFMEISVSVWHYLDRLENKLGNWHDLYLCMEWADPQDKKHQKMLREYLKMICSLKGELALMPYNKYLIMNRLGQIKRSMEGTVHMGNRQLNIAEIWK